MREKGEAHLIHCSFPFWYKKFKERSIYSKIISLPEEFINYLKSDSIFLPLQIKRRRKPDPDFDSDSDN
jgi:hypothetical protein